MKRAYVLVANEMQRKKVLETLSKSSDELGLNIEVIIDTPENRKCIEEYENCRQVEPVELFPEMTTQVKLDNLVNEMRDSALKHLDNMEYSFYDKSKSNQPFYTKFLNKKRR